MKKRVKFEPIRKMPFKKGDVVQVISGDDRGKHGKILQVLSKSGRVLVEGLNLMKRHVRKTQDNPNGGIVEKEAPLRVSKLKLQHPAEKAAEKKA